MAGTVSHPSVRSDRFNAIGSAAVEPASVEAVRRVLESVAWGIGLSDKLKIALYYGLRVAFGVMRRDHDFIGRMHPEFWIGDVTVRSPIGYFACRARTVDFDIVNPNYEAIEVERFRDRLLRATGEDLVCLDIGAHVGKFGVLAGRLLGGRGTVLAFEPEPNSFAALQRNLGLNRLGNVEAFNLACGDFDGPAFLSRSMTKNIGGHTLRLIREAEQIPVIVRTLDRFLPEQKVDHVDVMKLDVEGKEADVLRGARGNLEANPQVTVFFEETEDPRTAESILLLQRLGFNVVRLAGNIWVADRSG